MPRLNPDRQIAHALQQMKTATRMLKQADAAIRSALKQRSSDGKKSPRSRPGAGEGSIASGAEP